MPTFERGSALVLEAEFKKTTPFVATPAYFDPSPLPKITVTDPQGVAKVSAVDMTKSTTGKYYYICQTATTWAAGKYATTVTSVDGSNSDVGIDADAFELT
jgi:hypothetical protein